MNPKASTPQKGTLQVTDKIIMNAFHLVYCFFFIQQRVLRSRNYYTVLDLGSSASTDDVKRSYKSLAIQIHPDKNSAPDSEKAFQILGKAYETLKDPEKRHVYNFQLECALEKPAIIVSTLNFKNRQYTYNPEPHVCSTEYSDVVDDDDDLNDDDITSKKMPEFTYFNTRYTPKTTYSKFKTKCEEFLGHFIVILVLLGICYYGHTGSPAPSAPSEPPECNIGRFCLLKTRVYTARMLTKETETVFYVRPTYQPRGKRELEQLWADVEFAVNKRPYKHIP